MRESVLRDNSPGFVDRVLEHDIHWRHFEAVDELDVVERDGDAVALFYVLSDELY